MRGYIHWQAHFDATVHKCMKLEQKTGGGKNVNLYDVLFNL